MPRGSSSRPGRLMRVRRQGGESLGADGISGWLCLTSEVTCGGNVFGGGDHFWL
ncbi:hypothetical protein amrb99_07200 [Actinomadura sp. RB99]|nr:hypothetical protein [Actinomadura sp. RB99]